MATSKDHRQHIGIDFDNTLICYDEAFLAAAKKRGLVSHNFLANKRALRDAIRQTPDGELHWQKLQGYVYGQGLDSAALFEGAGNFLVRCREEGYEISIVSHKTQYGHYDPEHVDLRKAALGWMEDQRFFSSTGFGIARDHVYLEASRPDKLVRIGAIRCTHFIDDLEEVLSDPGFPMDVDKILFCESREAPSGAFTVCRSWQEIEQAIFHAG